MQTISAFFIARDIICFIIIAGQKFLVYPMYLFFSTIVIEKMCLQQPYTLFVCSNISI